MHYMTPHLQVRASVLKGITDMAKQNLEQEQLISEVKNHIAIVRSALICKTYTSLIVACSTEGLLLHFGSE